jgi:hypothetical protein
MSTQTAMPARVNARQRRVTLYNPSHLQLHVAAFGQSILADPFAEFDVRPMLQHPRNEEDGRLLMDAPLIVKMPVEDVADQICSVKHWGRYGVCIIDGTEQQREAAKLAAREKWLEFYSEIAERGIREWEAEVALFLQQNPGEKAPRQPHEVQEYYAFRKMRKSLGRADHVCRFCGAEFDSTDMLGKHQIMDHPGAQLDVASAPAPSDPAKDKAKARGAELLALADGLGLELSVADKKGLTHGDVDVIADIAERVGRAAAAAKKKSA